MLRANVQGRVIMTHAGLYITPSPLGAVLCVQYSFAHISLCDHYAISFLFFVPFVFSDLANSKL